MQENEAITAEVVETDKEAAKTSKTEVLRNEKGQLISGFPGAHRPKGALSKFTQMKNDLLEAWKSADGKKRFLEMLKSSDPSDFKWAVERIIAILPKEALLEIKDNGPVIHFEFVKQVVLPASSGNDAATGLQTQKSVIIEGGANEKV